MKTRLKVASILLFVALAMVCYVSAEITEKSFDSASIEGYTFFTAKLGLEINGTVPFNITNMDPGINQTQTMNIKNNGTIIGNLTIGVVSLNGLENESNLTVNFEINNTVISELRTGEIFNCTLSPEETIQLNMTVCSNGDVNQTEFDLELKITNGSWWWTEIIENNTIVAATWQEEK